MFGKIMLAIILFDIIIWAVALILPAFTPVQPTQKDKSKHFFDECCKSIVHTKDCTKTTMPRDNTKDAKNFADWLTNKNNHS